MKSVGFRQYKTLLNTTSGDIGTQWLCVEVTNNGSFDVLFYANDYPEQGHPATDGIPIRAGETREIPLQVLKFTATGPVDVVAYGM